MRFGADLARTGVDLAADEVCRRVRNDAAERRVPIHEVVLVAAVAVALAVTVVLVDDQLLPRWEDSVGGVHGSLDDQLGRLVEAHHRQCVGTFGRRQLGMRVIDVVARTVGQHGVDEMRLDFGRQCVDGRITARVVGG